MSTPLSEAIYVRNNADGALCSPTAWPFAQGRHITRHGFGVTRYLHQRPDLGLDLDLVQFVPRHDPLKISRLRLRNRGPWPASFTVTWYAEIVLGQDRRHTADHLVTEHDTESVACSVATRGACSTPTRSCSPTWPDNRRHGPATVERSWRHGDAGVAGTA